MEHISTTTLIVTLLIMVVISAYFSGSETGMMTLNRYRLRHRAKQGNRQAKRVEKHNLFSAENIDKAVLSIVAWFVYIVLLWGHYHEGWRGRRVVWFLSLIHISEPTRP